MILIRDEERKQAEDKKRKMLSAYVAIACVCVAAVLLLLLLSPDRCVPFLVGDIVLSIAFGFYSIYFFTVSYDLAVKRSKLLDKIAAAMPERHYAVFLREEERMTVEGLEMRILLFKVRGDDRELHVFESEQTFEAEKKYLLEVHSGVITGFEKVDE